MAGLARSPAPRRLRAPVASSERRSGRRVKRGGGSGDRAGGGQTDRSCPQAEAAAISVFIASVRGPN